MTLIATFVLIFMLTLEATLIVTSLALIVTLIMFGRMRHMSAACQEISRGAQFWFGK